MIDEKLQGILGETFEWFHSFPELPYEEFKTTAQIRKLLEKRDAVDKAALIHSSRLFAAIARKSLIKIDGGIE